MKITVAICTGMKQGLAELLEGLIRTYCDEILIVGTEACSFPSHHQFKDPRVRIIYASHALSCKRNKALSEAKGEVLAYVDDDAIVSEGWYDAVLKAFEDPSVGIVTGPSLLPPGATLWKKVAQLAMSSTQYSKRRYSRCQNGYVEWYNVIGANVAFRREALEKAKGCPEQFLAQGDDMAMAYNVSRLGWKVYYDPSAFVYHQPHGFLGQVSQIYRFGRAAKRLKRAGIAHPPVDLSYYLYIPVWVLFACAYKLGEIGETLIRDRNLKTERNGQSR